MRQELPLQLDRDFLRETASDIKLRLQYFGKDEEGSDPYDGLMEFHRFLLRLADMDTDNPNLDLGQYAEIWMSLRDGMAHNEQLHISFISIDERRQLETLRWAAEVVWRVACVNAAIRRLEGTKVAGADEATFGGGERAMGYDGDLRGLARKIFGVLLDSKDGFPLGKRWFNKDEEERILEVAWRIYEGGKKRDF
jgi:hypothetical protein